MKCELPSLGSVDLVVDYHYDDVTKRPIETYVTIMKDDDILVSGGSACHPKDQVVKVLGRKYAILDLIKNDKNNPTPLLKREDRAALFMLLCNKFFTPAKTKELLERKLPHCERFINFYKQVFQRNSKTRV